jgi:hypothetical protein
MRPSWILATVIACGTPAPPPAAPKGPTACERASDSMVLAMLAQLPAGATPPTEEADALRNLIRARCEEDGWSAEATQCLIGMKQLADAEPCAKLLTDAQQAALVRDQEAQLASQRAAASPAGSAAAPAPESAPVGSGAPEPAPSGSGAPEPH